MTTLVLADLCASQRAVLAAMPVVRRAMPDAGGSVPAQAMSPLPGVWSPSLPARNESGVARTDGAAK